MNVDLYFNFRSPYCYLASKSMFDVIEKATGTFTWKPLGGWDGRSPPERAKVKIPLTRQDVARWTKRMKIPYVPPPVTTDPTLAALGSLLAEERGKLREWVVAAMHAVCGEGKDIGDRAVMHAVGAPLGLAASELDAAFENTDYRERLAANWRDGQAAGVIGVPTFVVGDQIFWGNDRLDFLREYLSEGA